MSLNVTPNKRVMGVGDTVGVAISFASLLASTETISNTSLTVNSTSLSLSSIAATTAIRNIDGLSVAIGQGITALLQSVGTTTSYAGSFKMFARVGTTLSQSLGRTCPVTVVVTT